MVAIGWTGACALERTTLKSSPKVPLYAFCGDASISFELFNMRDAGGYLLISDTYICWRKFIISNNFRTLVTLEGKSFLMSEKAIKIMHFICVAPESRLLFLRLLQLDFLGFLLLTHSLSYFSYLLMNFKHFKWIYFINTLVQNIFTVCLLIENRADAYLSLEMYFLWGNAIT